MITTVCDEGDFLLRVTKYAVLSLARHMPNERFCLVLINGSGTYDDEIRSWHPRLILRNYPVRIREEFRRGYQFCYMTLPLHDLLTEYDEPLIYVDSDVIVRGSLQPVFDALKTHDLIVRCIPHQRLPGPTSDEFGARLNNGLTALANNEHTRAYTLELRRRVVAFIDSGGDPVSAIPENNTVTGLDQELMWVVYSEMMDRIRLFPLDDRFNDARFHKDSIVWHAKGTARNNPAYLFAVARIARDYPRKALLLPKLAAFRLYARLRAWRRGKNIRAAFTIPDLEDKLTSLPAMRRVLLLNSNFGVCNPSLLRFEEVDCLDPDPVWYYHNKGALAGLGNVRHEFLEDLANIEHHNYDLIVTDHHQADVPATLSVRHCRDLTWPLIWNRTSVLRGLGRDKLEGLFTWETATRNRHAVS